jgi:hypothetical protein
MWTPQVMKSNTKLQINVQKVCKFLGMLQKVKRIKKTKKDLSAK